MGYAGPPPHATAIRVVACRLPVPPRLPPPAAAPAPPALGGQAIGSIIGTIIGLYSHGPKAYQLTHGIADELLRDLGAEGSLSRSHRSTVTFQYDEVRLARLPMDFSHEKAARELGYAPAPVGPALERAVAYHLSRG